MKFSTASIIALSAISADAFAPSNPLASSIATRVAPKTAPTNVAPLNAILKKVLSEVVDLAVGKGVIGSDKTAHWSRETELIMREIPCAATQAAVVLGGPGFVDDIQNLNSVGDNVSLKSSDVSAGWKKSGGKWKKARSKTSSLVDFDFWKSDILVEDDMTDNERFSEKTGISLTNRILRSDIPFPLDDCDFCFADMAQAERVFKDLMLNPGAGFPVTYNTDFNTQTDESFSRIFFHGLCAPLMMTSDEVTDPEHLKYGPFMVDIEFAGDLKVRNDKYKKFGARIHFDENQMVSAIYDCDTEKLSLPGDDDWEAAKMQAKVTGITLCTVREHLAQSHLMVANDASREVVQQLHPEHPIRRLLAIFTYNTVSVNQNASDQLVPENCVIFRALPLDYDEGVKPLFKNSRQTSVAFEPFPNREIKNPAVKALTEITEDKPLSGFPYYNEGVEYYEIARTMVSEWLEEAGDEARDEYAINFYEAMKKSCLGQEYELPEYSHDNMVDLVSTIVWTVTGYHEIIGHVPDYFVRPDHAGFRLTKKNPLEVDIQSAVLGAVIAASTSLPAPQLMAEYPNYIGIDAPAWERDVWTKFLYNMGLQAKKVQTRDRDRDFEFKYFDPSLFECSISV